MDPLEQALQKAKRNLLKRYEATFPISPTMVETILDDFIEECRGKEPKEPK